MSVNRVNIDFSIKVKDIFKFLVSKYNFRLIEEVETFVRYESDTVFINFYHGRSSFEIGVEMGLLKHEGDSRFRLPTIMAALAPEYKERVFFQANESKVVEKCLIKVSELLQKYCIALIKGDESTFLKVSVQQQLEGAKLHEEYTINPVKEDADKAWHEKRYADVVKLYSSVEHYLTNTEKKRLEFARKHHK